MSFPHRKLAAASLVLALLSAPAAFADCGQPFTPVSQIQGTASASPLVGKQVTVEGAVTGDFTGRDRLSGFYIASAAADADDDSRSSEGLFVHIARQSDVHRSLAEGRRVRVSGRVKEYHGLTELTAVSVVADCGAVRQPLPARLLQWPLTDPERLEGMPVQVGSLVVVAQRELARYGTLAVAPERLFTPTQVARPGTAAAITLASSTRQLLLDDGSNQTFPDSSYRLRNETERPLRLGDRVKPFTAIVDYRYGHWRLQPLGSIVIEPANNRPKPPAEPGPAVRLASFNLANFFNGDGQGGGFPSGRGAETEAEYRQQKARLVQALALLEADLIAVSEIENDGFGRHSAIADLARSLGPGWRYVDFSRAGTGSDEIANGILYRQDRLTLAGPARSLIRSAFAKGNRPALAAPFRVGGREAPFVVVANHLKSKRCGRASGANADQGDGQGCWAALRTRAVRELVRWVGSDPTGTEPTGTVLLGDFNSYRRENPMQELAAAGYHDPAVPGTYSYVYDGQLGTLDYTWVSDGLEDTVRGAGTWQGNVDEHGFAGAESGPWGISDHDPVWVDLEFLSH